MSTSKFPCTFCDRTFDTKGAASTHEGAHRRAAAKSANKEAQRQAEAEGALTCPECPAVFAAGPFAARQRGKHRRDVHGIRSPKSIKARAYYLKAKEAKGTQLAIQPEKPTIKEPTHEQNGTPTGRISTRVIQHPAAPAQHAIDPVAYALCVGQIIESCRHFAEKHDFPARQFTADVARLFLDQTRR